MQKVMQPFHLSVALLCQIDLLSGCSNSSPQDQSSPKDDDTPPGNPRVVQIASTQDAFSALRADGSVVTWGNADEGGNNSAMKKELNRPAFMRHFRASQLAAI